MNKPYDLKNIDIRWVTPNPIINLKDLVGEMLPPGKWVDLGNFMRLLEASGNHLMTIDKRRESNYKRLVINRNLAEIALVVLPARQRSLKLSTTGNDSSDATNTATGGDDMPVVAQGHCDSSAQAIKIAENLLNRFAQNDCANAETYLEAIQSSPEPEITANALKLAGEKFEAHGKHVSYKAYKFDKFPKILESSEKFIVRFSDFGELGVSEVIARFEQLHIEGQKQVTPVGVLMKDKRRAPVRLAGSPDSLLFRIGAVAGLDLKAKVTVTISTYDRSIQAFTLISLSDRNQTLAELEKVVSQLKLPLDGLRIDAGRPEP